MKLGIKVPNSQDFHLSYFYPVKLTAIAGYRVESRAVVNLKLKYLSQVKFLKSSSITKQQCLQTFSQVRASNMAAYVEAKYLIKDSLTSTASPSK